MVVFLFVLFFVFFVSPPPHTPFVLGGAQSSSHAPPLILAVYWANIGRVVFGASNDRLMALTGAGNGENFTMRWRCAEVIAGGQKDVEVVGPLEAWQDRVSGDADLYWAAVRGQESK